MSQEDRISTLLLKLYKSEFMYVETKQDMSLLEHVEERTKQTIIEKLRALDQSRQFAIQVNQLANFMDTFWKVLMVFHDRESETFPKTRARLDLMIQDLEQPYRVALRAIFDTPLMTEVREPMFLFTNEMSKNDVKTQFASIQNHVRTIIKLVIQDECVHTID